MKYRMRPIFFFFLCLFFIGITSCNRGSGCPAQDAHSAQVNKKGMFSSKKGKTGLFPKQVKKKMGVRG
jgi:hypothetical protein